MKKTLLTTLLLSSLAALPVKATQFWYDVVTNYPGGGLTTNTTLWFPHQPGSLTAHDTLIVTNTYTSGAAVNGKRLRVNGQNSEYIMRLFDQANTNIFPTGSGTILYASFIANANFIPAAGAGTYFAAFNDLGTNLTTAPPGYNLQTNGFNFRARVYEIGNTNLYPFTNTVAGTFRYGVANAANDPPSGLPSVQFVPVDLTKNVDYQVVLKYDMDNGVANLWVNPTSESDTANMSAPTSDLGGLTYLAGLLFRQRVGGGTVDVRDIVVGDSFADVMTNTTPGSVLVATNFNVVTNFPGTAAALEVFATSIGGGPLSYQWYHVSGGVTNPVGSSSQTYVISQLASSDTGNYFCAVTNSGNVGALSGTNFFISVKPSAGLGFVSQPVSQGATIGTTLALSCVITGSGPYTIQWFFNGNALTENAPVTGNAGDISFVTGSQSPTLAIAHITTNETGDFSVTVSTGAAVTPNSLVSTNAHVVVNLPKAVNIAYLRSLEDKSTWLVTNTTDLFAISNAVVISYTNTSGVGGYYVQDATAGINLFVSNDPTFIPQMGDIVSAVGVLSSFSHNLELACFVTSSSSSFSPFASAAITGHTNFLPAPFVFGPWSLTNNPGFMETNMEGSVVMLTNVFFTTTGSIPAGSASTTLTVTNSRGEGFLVFFAGTQDQDIRGRAIPKSAWTITGILNQFISGTGTPYSAKGYEVSVTRWGDILTNPPPPVTATITLAGNNATLNWAAVPYVTNYTTPGAYSYSILASTNIDGPYLPVASGLTFSTANGTFTDTISGSAKFYRVVSP